MEGHEVIGCLEDGRQTGAECVHRHLRPAVEDLVWRAALQSGLCSVR